MSGLSTSAMDKRPFKGKGGSVGMSQWVLEWQSRNARALDRVVRDMEAVAQESKSMPGSQWYLYLHYRKDTGQYFLMWRSYGARKHVHVSWDRMQGMLERMDESVRRHYAEVNLMAQLLNAKEKAARTALNLANGLLEGDEE